MRKIELVLRLVEYHRENYLVRTYELRERTCMLVAAASGSLKIAGQLKSKQQRSAALQSLQGMGSAFVKALETLLVSLDDDIALRNRHTHTKFVSVGLMTDNGIFDPADSLLDFCGKAERVKFVDFLREEIGQLVDEHVAKGKAVYDATWALLEVVRARLPSRSRSKPK